MIRKEMKPVQALRRLEDVCARSEQCSYDLMKKLHGWGISRDIAEKIMARLERDRYVDDRRFACAYCRDKFRFSRWGRMKIIKGLMLKHISREDIDEALVTEIGDEEYYGTLVTLLQGKVRQIVDARSYDGRARLLRFAVSRGFESSMVVKVINSGVLWQED